MSASTPIEITMMELALPIGAGRLPRPLRSPARRERRVHGVLGVGSLVLHALAALLLIAGTRTLELPVRRGAAGDFEHGPRAAVPMIATFIESEADAPGELVALAPATTEWTVPPLAEALPMPALDALERLATADEAATAAAGLDESERLRGIYRAQLEARIERAWERPPLIEAGLLYACRVTLTALDEPSGPEMDFSDCAAGGTLRDSLETAIRRALPLPAPPSSLAPPRTLVLEFAAP